jgi:tRNA A37 threonylcarbamoyltransferase TsaD
MSDRFLRNLLKSKGFSTNVAKEIEKAVEKKALKESQEKEMRDREIAAAMTRGILNEVLPHLRKALEQKPPKKVIISGEKD